jgi:hypothetical protein
MKIFDTRHQLAGLLTAEQKERLARPCFFIGVDLGQSADYSTFIVLERHGRTREDYEFHCRDLYRWQLRTPYPKIVSDVIEWVNDAAFSENVSQRTVLAIDKTGVGAAVSDLFKQAQINAKLIPVSITSGSSVTTDADSVRVPKRELCGVVAVALQSDKLKFAKEHPLTATLRRELENFEANITARGNDVYGAGDDWRVGNNDDLVLGLALALWCGMNEQKPAIFYSFEGY